MKVNDSSKTWLKFLFIVSVLCISIIAQQRHEVTIRNIEIPLRVFKGNLFVDDLTIEDIVLLEDGKLQKIQALYLLNNTVEERKEGERDFGPVLPRNFYFVFQLTDYDNKMKEALDFFFTEIYVSGDKVDILTTYKEYSVSAEALESNTKDEVVDYINDVIRKDILTASKEYKKVMRDLKRVAGKLASWGDSRSARTSGEPIEIGGGGVEYSLARYSNALKRMEDLRIVEEKRLLSFAFKLKKEDGPKIVFFFYQKEYRPELNQNNLQVLMANNQDRIDIQTKIQELFELYHKKEELNIERLKQAYADSSIQFNFAYVEKKPEYAMGVVMRELSGDIKNIFSNVAHATGGIADDSSYPQDSLRNMAESFRRCYLIYYSPEPYVQNGKFKNIEIRVKNHGYKIYYRNGYIAN